MQPGGDEVAAVEGVVEECGEFEEEGVGEEVGLVEDEDGLDVLHVDEVEHGALDVGPELAAAVIRLEAELASEGAVDAGRGERGVAVVEDAVARAREVGAEVADAGGFAGAGVADEDAETWLIGQPGEEAGEAGLVVAVVVEGGAAFSGRIARLMPRSSRADGISAFQPPSRYALVPVLDRPRRELHALAVRLLVLELSRAGEVGPAIAVPQAATSTAAASAPAPADNWATTSQVAASAGIHETTVGRWLKLGLLPAPEVRNMGRRGRTTRWPLVAPAQARWVKSRLDAGLNFEEIRAALERGEFVP